MAVTNKVRYETSQYHEHRCRPGHLKSPVGRTGLLCLAPEGCCFAREALTYPICLQLCYFNYNNYIYIIIRVHHVLKYTRAVLPHAALCQLYNNKTSL